MSRGAAIVGSAEPPPPPDWSAVQHDILCPLCHANLTDQTISKNLARIKMIDSAGEEYDIYFSEIMGETCTYKISANKKVQSYGENAPDYQNYWGETPKT